MLERNFLHFFALALVAQCVGLFLANAVCAQDSRLKFPASAQMQVIYDSGDALPLGPYISYLLAGTDQDGVLDGLAFPYASRLPVAVLPSDAVQVFKSQWMTHAMFLVGTDPTSATWLQFNQDKLARMGAWGMVVQADSALGFKELQRIAEGLPLAPVQSDWLEQVLVSKGAGVIPLLVQDDGIARQILPTEPSATVLPLPALDNPARKRFPPRIQPGVRP